MHEVLFTKGDVVGLDNARMVIDVPTNCVLVHPGGSGSKCHAGATTKEGQRRAIKHLIRWCGYNEIEAYIAVMNGLMKGNQAKYAHNLLKEVRNEMQGMQS